MRTVCAADGAHPGLFPGGTRSARLCAKTDPCGALWFRNGTRSARLCAKWEKCRPPTVPEPHALAPARRPGRPRATMGSKVAADPVARAAPAHPHKVQKNPFCETSLRTACRGPVGRQPPTPCRLFRRDVPAADAVRQPIERQMHESSSSRACFAASSHAFRKRLPEVRSGKAAVQVVLGSAWTVSSHLHSSSMLLTKKRRS